MSYAYYSLISKLNLVSKIIFWPNTINLSKMFKTCYLLEISIATSYN